MEHYRACNYMLSVAEKKIEAMKRAEFAFREVTKFFKVPFARISIQQEALKEYGGLLIWSVTSFSPL